MAFVMELCGDSLFSVLHAPASCRWRGATKPIPVQQTVKWARGAAEAVLYLHSQSPRIVHRDLKSHNLMLAADGSLKLCDFGLVHHPDPGAGTPQYMAPELLAGGKAGFSDRVDVYAFGIMLWEVRDAPDGQGGAGPPVASCQCRLGPRAGPRAHARPRSCDPPPPPLPRAADARTEGAVRRLAHGEHRGGGAGRCAPAPCLGAA